MVIVATGEKHSKISNSSSVLLSLFEASIKHSSPHVPAIPHYSILDFCTAIPLFITVLADFQRHTGPYMGSPLGWVLVQIGPEGPAYEPY